MRGGSQCGRESGCGVVRRERVVRSVVGGDRSDELVGALF